MQDLKGVARGTQQDSDISSDNVDVVDTETGHWDTFREKWGVGLPEQEDFSDYALIDMKGLTD